MTSPYSQSATASGTKRFFERIEKGEALHLQAVHGAVETAPSGLGPDGVITVQAEAGLTAPIRFFHSPPNRFGRTGLWVSKVGFGGYRMHEHDPDHLQAIKRAIQSGVNLIDTSSNYTNGSSERVFGSAIRELIDDQLISRDEIVVVSKAGYIQGSELVEAKRLKEAGRLWPNTLQLPGEMWHSISPEFLEYSITRSLDRLKLDCIDVLLIHNPEVFFKSSKRNVENRDLFYRRMTDAFQHLEREVARGRIRHYGVTSNGLPEPENQSTHVSLTRLIQSAELARERFVKASSEATAAAQAGRVDAETAQNTTQHHFAVVQFPFNLFETNPLFFPNQNGQTLLERTREFDLGVMSNRPFNSLRNGRVVRIAPFKKSDPVAIKGELHTALGRALELERNHPLAPKPPLQGLKWAHELREPLAELSDVLSWRDFALSKIYPSIRSALNRLPSEAHAWRINYERAIQRLIDLITQDLECLANDRAQILVNQLDDTEPNLKSEVDLSTRALAVYWSLPQLHTVLIGMRKPAYVDTLSQTRTRMEETKARAVLERLQRHRN